MKRGLLLFAFAICALAVLKPTPAGYYPEECLHRMPNNAHIEENEDGDVFIHSPTGTVSLVPKCDFKKLSKKASAEAPLTYDGWLAYTTYQTSNQSGFDTFLGYFSVPTTNPTYYPQVLYIFTGLQNVDWIPIVDPEPSVFDIIQPVLQYPADSGNGWSVKSWYVTLNSGVLYSDEILTPNGDNIYGNMTRVAPSTWYIGGTSSKTGQTSAITVNKPRLATQPWAYNTLECYGCRSCSYEPSGYTEFSKLSLTVGGTPVTPSWVAHKSPTPRCNEQAVIKDAETVDIYFNY